MDSFTDLYRMLSPFITFGVTGFCAYLFTTSVRNKEDIGKLFGKVELLEQDNRHLEKISEINIENLAKSVESLRTTVASLDTSLEKSVKEFSQSVAELKGAMSKRK